MTHHQIFVGMRALLDDPKRWCQRSGAKDKDGKTVASWDERAVKWCISGAEGKVFGPSPPLVDGVYAEPFVAETYRLLKEACGGVPPSEWNDYVPRDGDKSKGRKHHEVIALLDGLIERTKDA